MFQHSLKNNFLIATPNLHDSFFHKSVIYICQHDEKGAMGVVINKTAGVTYGELLTQVGLPNFNPNITNLPALICGPVDFDLGFVLHKSTDKTWKGTLNENDKIKITGSKDILNAIATDEIKHDYLIGLGYAGWSAGQLEAEIVENSWLTCPANEDIIFMANIDEKFDAVCKTMNINWECISSNIGHA